MDRLPVIVKTLAPGAPETAARWDAFVRACPQATFFHLSAWQGIVEGVFRHRTHFLYAERAGEIVAVLPLEDTAISTSGDYERFFDERGAGGEVVRHHHLIDPATGRSPRGVTSVTILAPDGLTAEALSKAAFVLGPARGLELLETIEGVDAVIIDAQGRLHATRGLVDAGHPPARQQGD